MRITRHIACLIATVSFAAAGAAAEVTSLPGGTLDTAVAGADVYTGTPKAADPGKNAACRQAKTYVDDLAAGRFEDVAGLYADNAELLDPMRKNVPGHTNIHDFYTKFVGSQHPDVMAVGFVGEGRSCFVEIAAKANINGAPHWFLTAVDHFTLNSAGKFARMIAYARPHQGGMLTPPPAGTGH